MKAKTVSALRSERGLHRVNGAEPQVVGLASVTTAERKADTIKTYILCATQNLSSRKKHRAQACPDPLHWWPVANPRGKDAFHRVPIFLHVGTPRCGVRSAGSGTRIHPLSAQGPGEGAMRMEPDDAGLQPQTGAEPGELPKTDGGGGLKARRRRLPAKKLARSNL